MFTPSISSYELVTVEGDKITADVIMWRRYRIPLAGTRLVEMFLDLNPHLSKLHRYSPFIPPGTQVRIPIDLNLLSGRPTYVKTIEVWGRV